MRPCPPSMRLVRSRAIATTYELIVPESLGGYALCTVNDGTGELIIRSDWENWSYQWSPNPQHLGATNLTEFIGARNAVDYIADKLSGGYTGARQFSSEKTSKAFMHAVAVIRLEFGREAIEHLRELEDDLASYREAGHEASPVTQRAIELLKADLVLPPCRKIERHERHPLSKSAARALCDEIESLANEVSNYPSATDLFIERLYRILDGHDAHPYFEEAYDFIEYKQKFSDRVLRESILPVLIEACRQTTIARMMITANGPQHAAEAS